MHRYSVQPHDQDAWVMYDNIDHRPFMTADRESFADIDAIATALNNWWDRVSGPQKQVRHG